jgi:hypothetical protein
MTSTQQASLAHFKQLYLLAFAGFSPIARTDKENEVVEKGQDLQKVAARAQKLRAIVDWAKGHHPDLNIDDRMQMIGQLIEKDDLPQAASQYRSVLEDIQRARKQKSS